MGMYDITVESPEFTQEQRLPFYRLIVVKKVLEITRAGVSNAVDPLNKRSTNYSHQKEPFVLIVSILSEGLGVNDSHAFLANYFGISEWEIGKVMQKHRNWMMIYPRYKNLHQRCLYASVIALGEIFVNKN